MHTPHVSRQALVPIQADRRPVDNDAVAHDQVLMDSLCPTRVHEVAEAAGHLRHCRPTRFLNDSGIGFRWRQSKASERQHIIAPSNEFLLAGIVQQWEPRESVCEVCLDRGWQVSRRRGSLSRSSIPAVPCRCEGIKVLANCPAISVTERRCLDASHKAGERIDVDSDADSTCRYGFHHACATSDERVHHHLTGGCELLDDVAREFSVEAPRIR